MPSWIFVYVYTLILHSRVFIYSSRSNQFRILIWIIPIWIFLWWIMQIPFETRRDRRSNLTVGYHRSNTHVILIADINPSPFFFFGTRPVYYSKRNRIYSDTDKWLAEDILHLQFHFHWTMLSFGTSWVLRPSCKRTFVVREFASLSEIVSNPFTNLAQLWTTYFDRLILSFVNPCRFTRNILDFKQSP